MKLRSFLAMVAGVAEALWAAARRFPLTLVCAVGFAALAVGENHQWLPSGFDEERPLTVLLLGFFATLAVYLGLERRPVAAGSLFGLGTLALVTLRVYTLPPALDFGPPMIFLLPGFVLMAMVAPFWPASATDGRDFWLFNRRAWLGAAFGFVLALVLAIGLNLAHEAIETLFDLHLDGDLHEDYWMLALALFWPWYALSAIPRPGAAGEGEDCPRPLRFLIVYLLLPLALVYFAILYAYVVRILVRWSLPEGEVAAVVAGYACFGVAVHLMAYPLRESGPPALRLFYRYFYPALFVPIAALVVATWVRIDAYGLTEPRYYLVVLVVWLTGLAVFLTATRSERLVLIPASLAALLILASFGPWGAGGLSLSAQLSRLERLLRDGGVLVEGRLVAVERAPEGAESIASIIEYLDNRERLGVLDPWLADLAAAEKTDAKAILRALGLDRYAAGRYGTLIFQKADDVVEVTGFDLMIRRLLHRSAPTTELTLPSGLDPAGAKHELRLDPSAATLALWAGDRELARFDLESPHRWLEDPASHQEREVVLESSTDEWRLRLHLNSISGYPYGEIQSLDFVLLIGRRSAEPRP